MDITLEAIEKEGFTNVYIPDGRSLQTLSSDNCRNLFIQVQEPFTGEYVRLIVKDSSVLFNGIIYNMEDFRKVIQLTYGCHYRKIIMEDKLVRKEFPFDKEQITQVWESNSYRVGSYRKEYDDTGMNVIGISVFNKDNGNRILIPSEIILEILGKDFNK